MSDFGYVYQIINKINNKSYIGYTNNLEKRIYHHIRYLHGKTILSKAITKYGSENFIVRILEQPLKCNLQQCEKYWIKFYNTNKNGYNLTGGGDGGTTYGRLGKKWSNEDKRRLSESHKGQVAWNKGLKIGPLTKEHKLKIGDSNRGKKHPSMIGREPPNKGKTGLYEHSEETKRKMSLANKGKKSHNKGKKMIIIGGRRKYV